MKLYSYWRSSCSWRVRIALHYKQIDYTQHAVHLMRGGGEQYDPTFKRLSPYGRVPAIELEYKGKTVALCESLAILELLEDVQPEPKLLPKDIFLRGKARQLAHMIGSGIQPLQNLQVLQRLSGMGVDKTRWARQVIGDGLVALEAEAKRVAGARLVGDAISFADVCLVPQMFNARRFDIDVTQFETLSRIETALASHEAFVRAHADNQPDAPAAGEPHA